MRKYEFGRPWNPAYREVWDAMSDEEKRATRLFDLALLIVGLLFVMLLGGCGVAAEQREAGRAEERAKTDPVYRRDTNHGVQIYTDPGTGCQYLILYDKGITPRTGRDTDLKGGNKQVGCGR